MDIQGKIVNKLRSIRLQGLNLFSNLIMYFVLAIKKVKYGKHVRFWSTCYIVRYPSSTIVIGNNCSFRSDGNSNLIGVSRKCIISTHSAAASIEIGNNCGFSGTVIGCKESVSIGNNVICGANSLITDFDWHGIEPSKRRNYNGDAKPVIICDNVFIGYGAVVLKGVTIGNNSVIGANSVVTKDIPANVIAGGNPCRVIKQLA